MRHCVNRVLALLLTLTVAVSFSMPVLALDEADEAASSYAIASFGSIPNASRSYQYDDEDKPAAQEDLKLPATLEVTLIGAEPDGAESEFDLPVSWSSTEEYTGEPGEYVFSPVWDEAAYPLGDGVDAPTVTVAITPSANVTDTALVDTGFNGNNLMGSFGAAFASETIEVTTTGLDSLKVGESVTGSVIYTLSGGTYAAAETMTLGDFTVSRLPDGLTAETAERTSDTVVTISIIGIPTTYKENVTTLTYSANIPAANVVGASEAILPTGTISARAVAKGDGAAVSGAPTVSGSPTSSSITVNAVSNSTSNGQTVEYAISEQNSQAPDSGWQDALTFDSLTADTSYYVFARTKPNTNYNAGTAQVSNAIKTAAATKALASIKVTTPPTKTTYTAGETFDSTGMVVTAYYDDNSNSAVTGYTVTPSGALQTSDTTVTISYTEDGVTETATQAITVKKVLASIKVTAAPTKTTYTAGQFFNSAGMVITARYNDGSSDEVTRYSISPSGALQTSNTSVTISYTEDGVTETTTQAITVNAQKVLASIKVATAPTKTTYTAGETFDSAGMVVTATYEDTSTDDVAGYTVTPSGALQTSDTSVTISYTENGVTETTTQAITVNASGVTQYTITVSANPPSAGTVSGGGTFNENTSRTVTAIPGSGYRFVSWTEGGSVVNGSAKYTFTLTQNRTLIANFVQTGGKIISSGGGGGGGSSSGGSGGSASPSGWLEPNPAQTLSGGANQSNQDYIGTRSANTYGVRKSAWSKLANLQYRHDTMDGATIQVRLYIDKPGLIDRDVYVSGYVKGAVVEQRKAFFEKWFQNTVQAIHLDESQPWGQTVDIAAKVDLTGMDITNLYIYSYNKTANTYVRITNKDAQGQIYWIDKNEYLHFSTDLAGDIIVSEGPLQKK